MIPTIRVRKEIDDNPDEEPAEHEWAEYNLPFALLLGLSVDGEDHLAFVGLGTEVDAELPDGST
jgi:hypothetical protein